MADNIDVNPGKEPGAVSVATEEVGGIHTPIYKQAFGEEGEVILVDVNNPLPTANSVLQRHSFARQEELLSSVLLELRILNKYMSSGHDEEFTEDDLEE